MKKMYLLNLTKNTDELKRIIAENPDLPIVVLTGVEENRWMYCSKISFEVGELLDAEVPYQESVETDRINFEGQIEEWMWNEWLWNEMSEEDTEPDEEKFKIALEKEKEKYEPYWKKVIAIYATN